jgi:hypothetical protein
MLLCLETALVLLRVPGRAAPLYPVAPPPGAPPAADAPPGEVVVGVEPAVGEPAGDERTEDILVTGTRVRRKDLTTPAPVTVVNVDALQSTGTVSIGDFLQSLPEQEGGINTQINNGGDGSSRVSLRNLSENRTLVLLNGRRFVPAGGNDNVTSYNAVDLNAIPAAAIERVHARRASGWSRTSRSALLPQLDLKLLSKYSMVEEQHRALKAFLSASRRH